MDKEGFEHQLSGWLQEARLRFERELLSGETTTTASPGTAPSYSFDDLMRDFNTVVCGRADTVVEWLESVGINLKTHSVVLPESFDLTDDEQARLRKRGVYVDSTGMVDDKNIFVMETIKPIFNAPMFTDKKPANLTFPPYRKWGMI